MLIVCRMRNESPKFHFQLHFYQKNKSKRTSRDGESVQQQGRVKKIEVSFSVSTNHDM